MYYGNQLSVIRLDNGLLELRFDAKAASVNVFDNATVVELDRALSLIEQSEEASGLLITSGKPVFIVGADITEFEGEFLKSAEEMKAYFGVNNRNFNRLEDLKIPSVVAINGFALGGGLEFCLACDYRVMANNTKIGLPETGLGIIPGWGGTVRAPRLMGLVNAMTWVGEAGQHKAEAALEAGAVDAIADVDVLRDKALGLLRGAIENKAALEQRRARKTSPVDITPEAAATLATEAKTRVLKRSPRLIAPIAAIDLLQRSAKSDRTTALEQESELFIQLTKNEQSRALIGIFMNEQLIGKIAKGHAKKSSLQVEKAAVIGAGIMGGGVAYQNALKKMPVVMKDINQAALDLGVSEAEKLLSKKVRQERISDEQKLKTLGLIKPSLDDADLQGGNVIVEAVVENLKVKEKVLAELENRLANNGVLVSNTSTISISRLAKALKKPDKFAGMHFFNPVHAMPLVEIIRGKKTSDETIADVVAYSLALGKKPIVVNDCPAFLVNRVLFPYFRAFELLIRDGADLKRVDAVMETWGWPMGPAYLSDVCGIDTIRHCQDELAQDLPDRMDLVSPSVMDSLFQQQRFGQKNGLGFYQYQADAQGRPLRSDDEATLTLIRDCQQTQTDFSDEDIVIRCMLAMAIEMARCMEEGIVGTAAEADMALIYGLGFPRFRGGILRWMDEVGTRTLCQWSERFAPLGEAYRVTEHMQEMAEANQSFYQVYRG
ncbi:fatty acid oxidation complex subunit alpha FadB [Pseudomaricurvus alkylphenolicus]|uniref:fatty acid oxidation complex subunit alpha FadB n=1 Tax=Pseudomaricurvus alkylphenolicus TaxID=1306991 RepID=UPI00142142D8|nr:fatty acid oxidation complex subunit alpha FadB [Pseudomaricurvus alkylphenolicus]NIB38723.1 fatty acid oxidation complex subunit alpha FadB [Pseudomaricurvus alkylphenolicus]